LSIRVLRTKYFFGYFVLFDALLSFKLKMLEIMWN